MFPKEKEQAVCCMGFWRIVFLGLKTWKFKFSFKANMNLYAEYRQPKWEFKYFLRSWDKMLANWIVLYFISPFIALKHSFSTKFRVFSTVFFLMGKYFTEIFSLGKELMLIRTLHSTLCKEISTVFLGWVFVSFSWIPKTVLLLVTGLLSCFLDSLSTIVSGT